MDGAIADDYETKVEEIHYEKIIRGNKYVILRLIFRIVVF